MKKDRMNRLLRFFRIVLALVAFPGLLWAQSMEGQGPSINGQAVSTYTVPQVFPDELSDFPPKEAPMPFDEEIERLKRQLLVSPPPEADSLSIVEDSAVDVKPPQPLAPNSLGNFEAISYTGWFPPDPILAVGPSHVVVMVNSSWVIYDKTGTEIYRTTLTSWFSDVSPSGDPFDPWVVYDHHAGRWILFAIAKNSTNQSSYLISVSDDSDPNGNWWSWKLDATLNGGTATTTWADYPKVGFDDNAAVYITSNQFSFGTSLFQYAKLRILKKSELYWVGSGGSISWWDFWDLRNADVSAAFTVQPVQTLTSPGKEWLVNTEGSAFGDAITLWSVTNAAIWPPTLTREATVAIGTYLIPPNAMQPGGPEPIHTGDCRLYNAAYRSNRIYTAFPQAYDWGSGIVSAIHYVVIDTVSQSAVENVTYGADGLYYYYPAIYPDNTGNIYMVFNRSGSAEYAGIRYTGRLTSDSQMQDSAQLKAGEAYYVNKDSIGRNRWGDYNGIGQDPSSGTVWIYSEYAKPGNQWGTWVGEMSFEQTGEPIIRIEPTSLDFVK